MDTGRIKGRFTLLPVTCPQCQKSIWLRRRYPIYLDWVTTEPWKHMVANKWEVCENCCHEYVMYFREG